VTVADDEDDLPCYRHPGTLTALACSECDRPICGDCARHAPVGLRCPDCAPRPRRSAPPALLGFAALIVTAVVLAGVFNVRGNAGRTPMVGLPEAGSERSVDQTTRFYGNVDAEDMELAAADPRVAACAERLGPNALPEFDSRISSTDHCAVYLIRGDADLAEQALGAAAAAALFPPTT